MTYQVIGNTIAQWDVSAPLKFWLKDRANTTDSEQGTLFDLSDLVGVCEHSFLLHLKDFLIDRRNRVALRTIEGNLFSFKSFLLVTAKKGILAGKIGVIDEPLLLGISTFQHEFPSRSVEVLRTAFNDSPHSPIFVPGLNDRDFCVGDTKLGRMGEIRKNILGKALSRASVVEILRLSEELYESGKIDIGMFSFLNLAFAVYCRTESYRTIALQDLDYRKHENAWYIWIRALKHRVHGDIKIPYKINARLADILLDQRDHIINTYGHLVDKRDHPRLALFPTPELSKDKSQWTSVHANANFGQYPERRFEYFRRFQKNKAWKNAIKRRINAVVLRHTVGTQMAQAGLKAWAIQAVLKHADDTTCQVYVDIFMEGLIEQLSDALQPAFDHRLPVFTRFRSKFDPVSSPQAIECEDTDGRVELVGECGTELRCEAAPLGCYDCNRFIPCWDADHSINLNEVVGEINKYERAGLAFQDHVKKGKHVKYKIILVMNACDLICQSQGNNPRAVV